MLDNAQLSRGELDLIQDFILLPHMVTMVERSRQEVEQSTNPLRSLISRFLTVLLDVVNADLVKSRIGMSRANIKVWDDRQDGDVYYYRLRRRGHEEGCEMNREAMRSEIGVKLKRYEALILKQEPGLGLSEVQSDQPFVH